MEHSQHIGLSLPSADIVSALVLGCCPDCDYCSLGGCTAAVLPAPQPAFVPNSSLLMSHYNGLTESQLAVSLFRPPISR